MVGQMRHAVHQGVAKDKVCSWFAIFSKNPRSKFLIINDIRRRARGLGFGSESVRGMVIDGLVRCPKAGPKQRPDGEDSVMTESHRHPADPFLKETRRGKKGDHFRTFFVSAFPYRSGTILVLRAWGISHANASHTRLLLARENRGVDL